MVKPDGQRPTAGDKMSATMALEREVTTYKKKLPELLGSEGKFALIHDDAVLGVFDSYNDALKVGYEKLGMKPFLVRQISAVESVSYFSRHLG